nr:RNA-dependent RNA polymerase [Narnaviridae sp.]
MTTQKVTSVLTAVCKSIRGCGFPKDEEHQVEAVVKRQLEASGPEFVLDRLSTLRDWRKKQMMGDKAFKPDWFKYRVKHGATRPTDELGSLLWRHGDKAFFALVGAIAKAVELSVPTQKQLAKWRDGVRCENLSEKTRTLQLQPKHSVLQALETRLEGEWAKRRFFGFEDLTGHCIPGSGKTMSIRYDERHKPTPESLVAAYVFSVDTTPLVTWAFIRDMLEMTSFGHDSSLPPEYPKQLADEVERRMHDQRLIDEATMGLDLTDPELNLLYEDDDMMVGWYDDDSLAVNLERKGKDKSDPSASLAERKDNKLVDFKFGMQHPVGCLGFKQQEGGKLRVFANPGRVSQWATVPLGEVLQWTFYPMFDGCYTLNQQAGLEWASRKLKEGVKLSSFDMSAATDRLDFMKFLHEFFVSVYETDRYPVLKRNLEYFEDLSTAPWSIPGYVADLLGSRNNCMSWTTGQPLGLRPSFPLLSMMNCSFARQAVLTVDKQYSPGHYACVGDDMIIEDKYADAYMSIVRAFNGKINNDKSLKSDRFAEFCSQLITPSTNWPLKPRYNLSPDAVLNNIERFAIEGLKPKCAKWQKHLHDDLAAWSLDRFGSSYRSGPRSESLVRRAVGNVILDLVRQNGLPNPDQVSVETLLTRFREKGLEDIAVSDLASSYAEIACGWASVTGLNPVSSNIRVRSDKIRFKADVYDFFNRSPALGSTSVELSVKKEWDWRNARYSQCPTVSDLVTAKKLLRDYNAISVEASGNLVAATLQIPYPSQLRQKVECELIMEFDGKSVQALLSYRLGDSSWASIDVSEETNRLLGEKLRAETYDTLQNWMTMPVEATTQVRSPIVLKDDDLEL